jgi:hypothetical protein
MKFRILTLLTILTSFSSFACDKEESFNIGFEKIYTKYPEYKNKRNIFTIESRGDIWLVLRKDEMFINKPGEYPRVSINKKTCKASSVFWSK